MKTPEWVATKPRSAEAWAWYAFALCLLAVLGVGFAWYRHGNAQYASYQVHTGDAVSGLLVDAPVEFHGVEVGHVARISLAGPREVDIVLSIRKGTPISAATLATVTSRGLAARGFMGYVYIALEDAGDSRGPLALHPVSHLPLIAAGPSRSDDVDTAISTVNANVQTLTALMEATLSRDNLGALDASLHSLERVTATLAANSDRLNAILANADRMSRDAVPLMAASADSLRTMRAEVLPQANRMLADMQAASKTLAAAADSLQRNPSLLLRGAAAPLGPGERDGKP